MPTVHLVLGPVGAGKSTYATALAKERGALRLDLDEWMAVLFRPDRPDEGVMGWYVERVERCVEQCWRVARSGLAAGTDVVLELGLIRRADRERFYARVEAVSADLTVHLLDAPREVRRARVMARNEERGPTFRMLVPKEVFELASERSVGAPGRRGARGAALRPKRCLDDIMY